MFGDPKPESGIEEHVPPLDSDTASWLQSETAYVVDDKIIADSEITRWSEQAAANSGFHSTLVAPILWQGATIAALTFRSRHETTSTILNLNVANAIANQIAHQETLEQSRIRDSLA